jgi:hypothetical protein
VEAISEFSCPLETARRSIAASLSELPSPANKKLEVYPWLAISPKLKNT